MSDGADGRDVPPEGEGPTPDSNEPDGPEKAVERSETEAAARSGRPRLLPVWILLGGAAAAGIGWAVTDRMGGEPPAALDESSVPVISAPAEPYKVRPEDPGGMQVANRDMEVLAARPEEEAELILPRPEAPEPEPAAEPTESAPMESASPPDTPEAPSAQQVPEEPAEPAEVPATDPILDQATVEEPEPEGFVPRPVVKPLRPVARKATAPKAETAPPSPKKPAADGRFLVQLGSFAKAETARGEWTAIRRRHGDVVEGLDGFVLRADLGEQGIWYRLRAGPFPDRTRAAAACERLTARKLDCIVIGK